MCAELGPTSPVIVYAGLLAAISAGTTTTVSLRNLLMCVILACNVCLCSKRGGVKNVVGGKNTENLNGA